MLTPFAAAKCRTLHPALVLVSTLLSSSPFASAQTPDKPGEQRLHERTADVEKPAPKPERPLFPRHRRGMYRNEKGVEVIDATPQSPPLETDDPGVPEAGEYEINLTADADLSREAKDFDLVLVDVNYGMIFKGAPLQLKIEAPWSGQKDSGEAFRGGLGPAVLGVKYNIFNSERHGLMVSVYPQYRLAVPGSDAVERGLAEEGQTVVVPLLVSKALTRFALVGNLGVKIAIHAPDRPTVGFVAFAIGCPVTRTFAAMGEIRADSGLDLGGDRSLTINLGFMRHIKGSVIGYFKAGRRLFSDEGTRHTFLGTGLKVLIKPGTKGEKRS